MQTTIRRALRMAALAAATGGVAALSACGSTGASAPSAPSATPQVVNVELTGEIDTTSGAPGTFTGKDGWPAMNPSDIHVPANATVVLTIKEYDDVNTALPDGSPYNAVQGGTETVDGTPVTSIANDKIAHTFSIPALGINAPLPMAPDGGFTTIVFTFKTGAAGDYTWQCFTPCGDDPNGMGGAMSTYAWMKGHVIVG